MTSRKPPVPTPTSTALAPATLDGWYVLHQLFRLDWRSLSEHPDAAVALAGLAELLDRTDGSRDEGWSGAYRMVGAGVDLMLVHFRPTLEELSDVTRDVSVNPLTDFLILDHEYLSVVELGMYGATVEVAGRVDPSDHEAFSAALEDSLSAQKDKEFVQRRLYPVQPDQLPYVCYYPMDKRRGPGQNWYSLPLDKRAEMMNAHGTIGRRYAGRISQIISGSIGLGDWEWAVTLFAADPLDFKNVVTDMRYDEASAEYAEFGSFFVGRRLNGTELRGLLD